MFNFKVKGEKSRISVKELVLNERGDLSIFATKLGLGVIAVIVVVVLMALANAAAPDLFNSFINKLKSSFSL